MKTMTLYRPGAIHNAMSDIDRYFDSFFEDSTLPPASKPFKRFPAMDVRETDGSYVLEMELPGYDEKSIDIHIDGDCLSVASKQQETCSAKDDASKEGGDSNEKRETWILRERWVNAFSRSFKLPENANPEEVSAEFKNGILTMEIKKHAEARKRSIQIKAG